MNILTSMWIDLVFNIGSLGVRTPYAGMILGWGYIAAPFRHMVALPSFILGGVFDFCILYFVYGSEPVQGERHTLFLAWILLRCTRSLVKRVWIEGFRAVRCSIQVHTPAEYSKRSLCIISLKSQSLNSPSYAFTGTVVKLPVYSARLLPPTMSSELVPVLSLQQPIEKTELFRHELPSRSKVFHGSRLFRICEFAKALFPPVPFLLSLSLELQDKTHEEMRTDPSTRTIGGRPTGPTCLRQDHARLRSTQPLTAPRSIRHAIVQVLSCVVVLGCPRQPCSYPHSPELKTKRADEQVSNSTVNNTSLILTVRKTSNRCFRFGIDL